MPRKKIVTRRLIFLAGKLNLVSPNQFGGKSCSSTSDAILTFINDIHAAWNHDLVTSTLTFDIKGYFDLVDHKRLLQKLGRKRLPLEYVKCTANFLSDREVAICVDGIRGPMQPVENGIPQATLVSPILAAFYTAELLEIFSPPPHPSTFPHPDQATEVKLLIYIHRRWQTLCVIQITRHKCHSKQHIPKRAYRKLTNSCTGSKFMLRRFSIRTTLS